MIKLIETMTFKDGRDSTTHTKEWDSWNDFKEHIARAPISNKIGYKLIRYREAFIDYADGRVHLKVVEEPDSKRIIIHPPTAEEIREAARESKETKRGT